MYEVIRVRTSFVYVCVHTTNSSYTCEQRPNSSQGPFVNRVTLNLDVT